MIQKLLWLLLIKKEMIKINKYNNELCEEMLDKFSSTEDTNNYAPTKEFINLLPSLIDNNMCYKISKNEWCGSATNYYYRIFSMIIQRYNKKNKKYKRSLYNYEFGNYEMASSVSYDKKIVDLTKYVLSDGRYFAKYNKNTYLMLDIETKDNDMISTRFYIIGRKWNKVKKKIFKEISEYKTLSKDSVVERISTLGERKSIVTMFKSFDRLVIRNKKDILKYIDNWVECIPIYYNEYHIIPKLSILLYGEPGTGKSTFAKALAKYLSLKNIISIESNYFVYKDNGYNDSYSYMEPGVMTIDDIDCICSSRKNTKNKDNLSTVSKVLSFLDNPPTFQFKANDGRSYPVSIIVATTNYYDRLDSAVVRHGRFDLTIKMNYFNYKEAEEMCSLYNTKLSNIVKENIDKNTFKISPAKLEALCLSNLDSQLKRNVKFEYDEDGRIKIHRK